MSETIMLRTLFAREVRVVARDRPWHWLEHGWEDYKKAPLIGAFYGLFYAAVGWAILYGLSNLGSMFWIAPIVACFFLLAPVFAVGLYDASRRVERGENPTLVTTMKAVFKNPAGFAMMGLVLLLAMMAWMRIAQLLFALFFHGHALDMDQLLHSFLNAGPMLPLLIVGTVIGGVIALAVFAISAVSIPMLLDKPEVGTVAAIFTSIETVLQNKQAMLLWAAIIVATTALGLATMFIGLIVTLPVIGHATWHAYRELVA